MPLMTRSRPPAARPRMPIDHDAVAAVVACVVAGLVTLLLVGHSPAHVASVGVHNPTSVEIDVSVRRPGERDAVALLTVEPDTTTRVEEVLDQGARWRFEFARAGRALGPLTVSRTDLAAAGWKVTVPERVLER